METADGHSIYVEQCGNPKGLPVVVMHGGPGGGCNPSMRRYFNPDAWRIVLFDQRGCGRSRPHASVENNTTWHLLSDIEMIRKALGIARWAVFGGSWGATLSLIYAQQFPERVFQLFLRGVFLMTQAELDWFYGGGAGQFWPELWENFRSMVPQEERSNLITAYHKRLFSGDVALETRFAMAWASWENALASIQSTGRAGAGPEAYARAFARLENHYFKNAGFLEHDGQILQNLSRIAHIPGIIIQGRYDMICPPTSAWRLHKGWPASRLHLVPLAGHALSEPPIVAKLVEATDAVATKHGQARIMP